MPWGHSAHIMAILHLDHTNTNESLTMHCARSDCMWIISVFSVQLILKGISSSISAIDIFISSPNLLNKSTKIHYTNYTSMSTLNISKISVVLENYEFSFVYFEIVYQGNREEGYPPSLPFGNNKGRGMSPLRRDRTNGN